MYISKFKIADEDLDKFVDYLINSLPFEYENHSSDMSILAGETYYWRNDSTQQNMIVLKKEDGFILMDIIGSAGGSGILNLNWGSEKSFIKKVRKVLAKYVVTNKLYFEEIAESEKNGDS